MYQTIALALSVFVTASLLHSTAWAKKRALVDCTVLEVLDSSAFEESLSVDEYPLVSVDTSDKDGSLEVYVGASRFSQEDGDLIQPISRSNVIVGYEIVPSFGRSRIKYEVIAASLNEGALIRVHERARPSRDIAVMTGTFVHP